MKILMVCLGNICRSPLADGLMRKKVNDNKLGLSITLNFIFSNEGEKLKAKINVSEDNKVIDITLNQWNSETPNNFVENTEPLKLHTNITKKKFWVKYRTQTSDKFDWRNFHVTIWSEE